MENVPKSKFRLAYEKLPVRTVEAPRSRWVEHMASICMVSVKTVRCWLAGTQHPDALRRNILSKELKIPADELFTV